MKYCTCAEQHSESSEIFHISSLQSPLLLSPLFPRYDLRTKPRDGVYSVSYTADSYQAVFVYRVCLSGGILFKEQMQAA